MIMQWFSLNAPQQPKKLTIRHTTPMTMINRAALLTSLPKNAKYSLNAACSTAPPIMNTKPITCAFAHHHLVEIRNTRMLVSLTNRICYILSRTGSMWLVQNHVTWRVLLNRVIGWRMSTALNNIALTHIGLGHIALPYCLLRPRP